MDDEARRLRWERRSELPLMATALLFLAAFAWPVIDPGLDPRWRTACGLVVAATWVAFAVDYAARVVLSRDRWAFVRRHPLDLLIVVLPLLRPLALLRLLVLLGVLNRRASSAFHGRVAAYIALALTLVVTVGALAMLQAERGNAGATIESFGDAVWWALATVTTVGYGDEYPTTGTGRVVAATLMLSGIALLGAVTAGVASWLVHHVAEEEEETAAATTRDLRALTREVVALREEVTRLRERAD